MSGRPKSDYTRCPACGRRKVLYHFGRGGDDYLECSWPSCHWITFRMPEANDSAYGPETERWKQINGIIDTNENT